MANFIKKILGLRGLISLGSSNVIGTPIAAIFWFYLAANISPEEYGNIFYLLGIVNIAASIASIATIESLVVYIAKKIKIQSTLNFLSLILGIGSAIAIMIIFHRLDASLLVFGYILYTIGLGDLLGRKLYVGYSKYLILQKILTLIVGLSFYYFFGIAGILFALLITYIPFSIRIYKAFRESGLNFILLKSRIGFVTNNYIMNLVLVLWAQIDKLIIPSILGFTILGNYSLALQIMSVLMIISSSFFKYILPQDSSNIKNTKLKQLIIIMSIGIAIVGITVVPVLIPQYFSKYREASDAIRIMSIAVIPSTINQLYSSKFLALEKSKIVLFGTFSSLITIIVGMITLGSVMGLNGIALSFVLAQVAQFIVFITYKRFYIK